MRAVVISPLPNTIVFGAVPTGSIKAKLALMTAGTIINSGAIPAARAAAASTGMSSAAVAVLDVVSVRKVTTRQIIMSSANKGMCVMCASH